MRSLGEEMPVGEMEDGDVAVITRWAPEQTSPYNGWIVQRVGVELVRLGGSPEERWWAVFGGAAERWTHQFVRLLVFSNVPEQAPPTIGPLVERMRVPDLALYRASAGEHSNWVGFNSRGNSYLMAHDSECGRTWLASFARNVQPCLQGEIVYARER